jgi:ribosome-binding protein aMBF1 (putative translation factor)
MNKLKRARVLADMSQIELARQSGISLYRVQVCERDWLMPRADEIKKMAKVLKVKPTDLQGGDDVY